MLSPRPKITSVTLGEHLRLAVLQFGFKEHVVGGGLVVAAVDLQLRCEVEHGYEVAAAQPHAELVRGVRLLVLLLEPDKHVEEKLGL